MSLRVGCVCYYDSYTETIDRPAPPNLSLGELLLQLPFFFVCSYAFYYQRKWIRIPALVRWGFGVFDRLNGMEFLIPNLVLPIVIMIASANPCLAAAHRSMECIPPQLYRPFLGRSSPRVRIRLGYPA